MDIFNLKRVKFLQEELERVTQERDLYKLTFDSYERKIDAMSKLEESIPEGCERGPWCKACEFVRTFHLINRSTYGYHTTTVAYVCGKGASCAQFLQMKADDE